MRLHHQFCCLLLLVVCHVVTGCGRSTPTGINGTAASVIDAVPVHNESPDDVPLTDSRETSGSNSVAGGGVSFGGSTNGSLDDPYDFAAPITWAKEMQKRAVRMPEIDSDQFEFPEIHLELISIDGASAE